MPCYTMNYETVLHAKYHCLLDVTMKTKHLKNYVGPLQD